MANIKITDLTAYTDAASTDVLPIVDVGADVTKKITISNVVKAVPLGTAALPGLAFDGDPNTGIYSPGADQVAISTGGTGRLFVDASGNVGIGATPNAAFALDATAGNGAIRAQAGGFYVAETYSATNNIYRIYDNSGEFAIESQIFGNTTTNSAPIVFRTSNSGGRNERLRITSDGKLGLGTSSPDGLLHIASTSGLVSSVISTTAASDAELEFRNTSGGNATWAAGLDYSNAKSFNLAYAAAEGASLTTNSLVTVTTGGNVGIGTNAPAHKLTVSTGVDTDAGNITIGLGSVTAGATRQATITKNTTSPFELTFAASNGGSPVNTIFKRDGTNESARIDSSGRLLVGTSTNTNNVGSTPQKFAVVNAGDGQIGGASFTTYGGTTGTATRGNVLYFQRSRGTADGDFTIVANGDSICRQIYRGSDGSAFRGAAEISAFIDGTPGANDMPGRLVFSTTADGASTPTERMRLNSSGQLLVGTSSALNSADLVSISGQLAAGGQTMAALSKSVDVGNTVTFDITGPFKVLASVRIIVGYVGNNSYQMHAQYEYVSCNSGTTGATATQVGILQVEAGNAQFNYTDITVSRPSNATVRITYAPTSGIGTHTPTVYVNGVFASLT